MAAGDVKTIRGTLAAKQCVAFDGDDDYILADAHAVARVVADDTVGTYSAWIYVDDASRIGTIVSAGDNDSVNEYFHFYMLNGLLNAGLNQAGATQFNVRQTTASIKSKEWAHVAVVQNGTQPVLYVNGVNIAATNTTATDLTAWYEELNNCDKFAIGVLESNGTHTNDFKGMICEVKYWNKALTAAEIKTISAWDHVALDDDGTYLQLYLPLRTNTTDSGLGADNGTLVGAAYLCGWGSEWSRELQRSGVVVADDITTFVSENMAHTAIVKAA